MKEKIDAQIEREIELFSRALKHLLFGASSLDRMKLQNDIRDHLRMIDAENAQMLNQLELQLN